MALRYLFGVAMGVVVTLALFVLMNALISNNKSALTEGTPFDITDMVRVDDDEELQIKKRKPDPPPPPDEPPPDMPTPDFETSDVSQGIDIGAVNTSVDLNIAGTGGFTQDGEYLPIVKVAPIYPRRAQTRGIEGYVILEFTVTKTGAVADPLVVESKPPGIFDRAATNAALKFKYKPKVVDGVAISVPGVRNRITFELAD
jgi:protein TonB